MNLEARPWLVDLHAAAALDSFPFFWGFLLGLFLIVSASWGVGFSDWVVPGVFCVSRSEFSPWVVPGVFCVLRS